MVDANSMNDSMTMREIPELSHGRDILCESMNDAVTLRGDSISTQGRIDQYDLLRELGGGGFGTPDSAVRGKLRRNRHISVRQTRSAAPIVAIQTDCGGSNAVLVGNDIFMRPSGDINSQSLERMSLIIADTRGDGSHLINLRVHFNRRFVDPVGYIALLPQSANLVAGVIGHDCLRVAAQ